MKFRVTRVDRFCDGDQRPSQENCWGRALPGAQPRIETQSWLLLLRLLTLEREAPVEYSKARFESILSWVYFPGYGSSSARSAGMNLARPFKAGKRRHGVATRRLQATNLIPALKGRAKFMLTLRVEDTCSSLRTNEVDVLKSRHENRSSQFFGRVLGCPVGPKSTFVWI